LFLFGVFVAVVTIILKIMIEFPGLLKFKCIYKEQSKDNLEEIVEVDVDEVMSYYQHKQKKSIRKSKVNIEVDPESDEESIAEFIKKVHKHSHRHEDVKQIARNANEDISLDIDDESLEMPPHIPSDIPHQLTIKLHKKVSSEPRVCPDPALKTVSAVIEHRESAPSIEISAHHKHGHVRQH